MSRSVGTLCGTLLLAGSSLAIAQQYSITTAAGGAPPPMPVAAVSTSVGQPNRVAVDTKGNLFFSSGNAVFKVDSGGSLTPIAGNSRPGYSGDGGPATKAQLNAPQGMAVDAAGNIYIADSKNHRIRLVNTSGVISTFAGTGQTGSGAPFSFNDGGLAINALLRLPSGVALDKNGNLYIADTGNNLIRRVTTDGIINSFAGDSYGSLLGDKGPAINAELHTPEDVALDSAGNVYIADSANAAIRKVTIADGLINTIAGSGAIGSSGDGGLATKAALLTPFSVAVDSANNVYLVENGDSRIRKIDATSLNISTIVGIGTAGFTGDGSAANKAQLNFPTGMAVDSSGNIYIADSLNRRIRKVASSNISTVAGNGGLSYSGDGGNATDAQLNAPQAVAADSAGNLYIADTFNNVVRKVSTTGTITNFAGNGTAGFGGDGSAATSAQLNGPQGIAVDASGNVYVSDTQNARVRKISGGTISTFAGNGTPGFGGDNAAAASAQLNIPIGLAVDAAGSVYIADFSNNRIRKVTSGGAISTVAGNGLAGYSGDGGGPVNAQLTTPAGVTVDASGNLFIADTGNNAVREVANGIISTVAGNGAGGFSGDSGLATSAQVGSPMSVAVDSAGNIYIADGSARVRKVYTSGFITTIAGNGTRGYSGDGGSAPFSMLNGPTSLALLPNGNLYVADSGNNAVRLLIFGGYTLSISAVVNSASNVVGPVTGGEVVVFYGTGMGPAVLVVNQPDANGRYSTSLAGTVVNFGNLKAPILYTSANQVAAVVPLAVSGSVQAFIQYQSLFSTPFPVSVSQSSPGIYTADLSGKGGAAAINLPKAGGYSYNNAANPANAGDYVELFLTGTGPTNPPGIDGQPYAALASCSIPVSVTLGGKAITPSFCGAPAGIIPGLTQINIQIPTGLTAGLVPVTVQFGSVNAQSGVTVAVSGH